MSSGAEPPASAAIESLNKIDAACRLFASPRAERAVAMLESAERLSSIGPWLDLGCNIGIDGDFLAAPPSLV